MENFPQLIGIAITCCLVVYEFNGIKNGIKTLHQVTYEKLETIHQEIAELKAMIK